MRRNNRKEPKLSDLINFVVEETILVNDPCMTKTDSLDEDDKMENHEDQEETVMQCPVYEEQHDIEYCSEFLKLPLEDRNKMVFKTLLWMQ